MKQIEILNEMFNEITKLVDLLERILELMSKTREQPFIVEKVEKH